MMSPLLLIAHVGTDGSTAASMVTVFVLMIGLGALGAMLFGDHLGAFEAPASSRSSSPGPKPRVLEHPYLKAGLLSVASGVSPVYLVVAYSFLSTDVPVVSDLPRMYLPGHFLWSAVMAFAAPLALAAHHRYGSVLLALVIVASVGIAPHVPQAIENW
jgi:hypothetical protein